jgi:hypothetical protein
MCTYISILFQFLDRSGIFNCFNEFLCAYQIELCVELCVPLKRFLKLFKNYFYADMFNYNSYPGYRWEIQMSSRDNSNLFQVAGAAWHAAMRIFVGVGDLMQVTRHVQLFLISWMSWCAGGWCGTACSDEDRGRSRRPGEEDRGWSHRSGTRWLGDREVRWRRVRSAPCTWRRGAQISWLSLNTKVDSLWVVFTWEWTSHKSA